MGLLKANSSAKPSLLARSTHVMLRWLLYTGQVGGLCYGSLANHSKFGVCLILMQAFALLCADVYFESDARTGTPLGDPIEVGALGHALSGEKGIDEIGNRAIDLVSVKSHFGHTEGAAGLSGALFAMHVLYQHRKPAVRFSTLRDTMWPNKTTSEISILMW